MRRSGRYPRDDAVSVAYDFPRSVAGSQHPLRIRSSDLHPGGLPGHFGAELRSVVGRRRRSGGARKGRVLYVVEGKRELAVLAYHVPDRGHLEVLVLGADRRLARQDAVRLQGHLLACLEEAAALMGRSGTLAWATGKQVTAEVTQQVHGFKRARKPKGVKAPIYMTREPIRRARKAT